MAGALAFSNVELAYRPGLPPALAGVSFCVPGGTSCGVVGRTGAGKSSVLVALWRLVEVTGGAVTIDGVDAAAVGLGALRSALAMVPQEPVVLAGGVSVTVA